MKLIIKEDDVSLNAGVTRTDERISGDINDLIKDPFTVF